jgi:hypothetical protein
MPLTYFSNDAKRRYGQGAGGSEGVGKEKKTTERLKIMVSSTVYGIEDMLDRMYAFLHAAGFEVWMSHAGTVTVFPHRTALDNCLQAVDDCDLFLAVITPRYGSGVLPGQLGITHQELLKAIQLEKPRWILAHDHVVFARTLSTSSAAGAKKTATPCS